MGNGRPPSADIRLQVSSISSRLTGPSANTRPSTRSNRQPSRPSTPTHKIAQRVARYLEKAGYLVRDAESDYLDLQADDDDAMATRIGASSEASHRSYRLAFGPNAGRKAMTLQTIPATTTTSMTEDLISRQSEGGPLASRCMRALPASPPSGKSWNVRAALRFAGISHGLRFPRNDYHWRRMGTLSTKTRRPPKTAYDDGTTHVILSPMEFMGRLAALVPRPRMK